MKKLIALFLCGMMMVGSLCAFAEDGIRPLADCLHTDKDSEPIESVRDGCVITTTYLVVCQDCGYSYEIEQRREKHTWVQEIIDGEYATICEVCDEIK